VVRASTGSKFISEKESANDRPVWDGTWLITWTFFTLFKLVIAILEAIAMTRLFIRSVLITFARALLVHWLGNGVRVFFEGFLPGASPLICIVCGMAIATIVVEGGLALLQTRAARKESE
jgi:succinate-acetate transporter protein